MSKSKPVDPYAVVLRAVFPSDSALATALMYSNKRDLAERSLRAITPREEKVVRTHLGLMTPEAKKRLRNASYPKGTARGRARQFKARVLRKLGIPNQSERPPTWPDPEPTR